MLTISFGITTALRKNWIALFSTILSISIQIAFILCEANFN